MLAKKTADIYVLMHQCSGAHMDESHVRQNYKSKSNN